MNADLSFDPSIPIVESQTETDEIVYRISHDLRASVRALQELPSWIGEDLDQAAICLPPPTERHLKLIASHAGRLDLMLTGLLNYSRVGRMQPIASAKPIDVLNDVLDDLCLPEDVQIKADLDHGKIQMGYADLQRVFSALLLNAVRFHPENRPKIAITGGPISAREWQIEVADDGPGIPENKREFVFRPMTKLVSRDVDPGAGMGLAIVKKISETYGGSVDIGTPKTGVGTSVRVVLTVN